MVLLHLAFVLTLITTGVTRASFPIQDLRHLQNNDLSSADHKVWHGVQSFLTEYTWPHRKTLKEFIDRALADDRISFSSDCSRALHLFSDSIASDSKWAFQGQFSCPLDRVFSLYFSPNHKVTLTNAVVIITVLDSWGKMRPGLLFGEYTDFGKWDQCLAVSHEVKDITFKGKFCVFEFDWPLPSKGLQKLLAHNFTGSWIQNLINDADSFMFQQISNSICVPSACPAIEIEKAIQICTYPIRLILCF